VIESGEVIKKANIQGENQNTPVGTTKETDAQEPLESSRVANGSSNMEELYKKIQELEVQLKDKDNKHLYLYAEFDNFKKRAIKERSELMKFAWEPVARDLLQVMDNLERAIDHTPNTTDPSLIAGLKMILDQFKSSLEKQGVQKIESLNQVFDPNVHEAVGQEVSKLPTGTIVKEHEKGYTLHGRLLRPARVVISQGETQKKEVS
jgi:molecular chaperone GrpE